jgi:exonuclease VII large subunit
MPKGEIIKDVKSVEIGDSIMTRLHKGEILSEVKEVNEA